MEKIKNWIYEFLRPLIIRLLDEEFGEVNEFTKAMRRLKRRGIRASDIVVVGAIEHCNVQVTPQIYTTVKAELGPLLTVQGNHMVVTGSAFNMGEWREGGRPISEE